MRAGLLVIVLAGCAARAASGPAWPRPAVREVDGGESLAPRPAARAIAAIVEDDRPADKAASDKPAAPPSGSPAAGAPDKPAAAAPATAPPDDPIVTEDIVIEIED